MSKEPFWNSEESISKVKLTVLNTTMIMRQAGRIFYLDLAPLKSLGIHERESCRLIPSLKKEIRCNLHPCKSGNYIGFLFFAP